MTRTRILIIGLVALGLSAVITLVTYRELQKRFETTEQGQRTMVVAAEKLSIGMRLEEGHLTTLSWPEDAHIEGSFRTPQEVIGRGVIMPIFPNEPLLEFKLAPRGAGAGLTSAIPEGMRAVAVKVNDVVGVAGFVLPGTRVDVILSGSPTKNREIEVSKIILENVEVLAAGQNLERDSSGQAQKVTVITLLVSPDDAQKLALASNDGRLQLALRNPLDLEEVEPEAVKKASLYYSPVPQKPPAPRRRRLPPAPPPEPPAAQPRPIIRQFEVELIQGSQRETKTFKEVRNR